MLHSIKIEKFRLMKSFEFNFGKYITVIAGQNGTGKSNLLGIVGNMVELKKKKTIIGKSYKTPFDEIFKGSPQFDKKSINRNEIFPEYDDFKDDLMNIFEDVNTNLLIIKPRKKRATISKNRSKFPDKLKRILLDTYDLGKHEGVVNFCTNDYEEVNDYRNISTSWSKEGRFRVIPRAAILEGGTTSAKVVFPVIYLGLSRLFPLGEVEDGKLKKKNLELSINEKKWYQKEYNEIMFSNEHINNITTTKITGLSQKSGTGIATDVYDEFCNSAGQDNLGQFLLSILSFKRLKKKNNIEWSGGLFIVDEIDATLHAHVQIKLIDHLFRYAKKLSVQIIFTTHSLFLLKKICNKIKYNRKEKHNDYQIVYLRNDMGFKSEINPSYKTIALNMNNESNTNDVKYNVLVLLEDPEAEWFFKKICLDFVCKVELIGASFGCNDLAKIAKSQNRFSDSAIFIFDGDVLENKERKEKEKFDELIKKQNVLCLPGRSSPEAIFCEFLESLDEEDDLWKGGEINFTKRIFMGKHPIKSKKYNSKGIKRDWYKLWFKEHLEIFEKVNLYEHWAKANKDEVEKFKLSFQEAFKFAEENNET